MNRPNYFSVIEERINLLALRIQSRGRLNILDLHGHSENFYQYFLNELFLWSLTNENDIVQNVEAIDLIDHTNKFVIQVSATAIKQKLESSLSKDTLKGHSNFTFKFVSIAMDAGHLRKASIKNPHGIQFSPASDILDNKSILTKIRGLNIVDQKRVYEFVKKELVPETDTIKLESNLAAVINILSKEDWDEKEPVTEINSFEIDRKITHNNLNSAKIIIDDYVVHYGRVDKIYAEYDSLGSNKSSSVLSTIRQEYAKAKNNATPDQVFFNVIGEIEQKVLNSSNYTSIPYDELQICVNVLVVDAFVRCKIFENPDQYDYATTR